MTSRQRWILLCLALVLTVCAVVWVSEERDSASNVVTPASRTEPRKDPSNTPNGDDKTAVLLDKLQRLPMTVGELNPFNAKSWYVPPPPPPKLPPPKPTAPPLPFTYVGKLEEKNGRWVVYLAKGGQSYIVKKGETFDNSYRLDGIENGNLVIQYLPIPTRQLLPIGG